MRVFLAESVAEALRIINERARLTFPAESKTIFRMGELTEAHSFGLYSRRRRAINVSLGTLICKTTLRGRGGGGKIAAAALT